MTHWTLGEFLFWLALAIFVPAIIIHFTLGRNGGHRLFEKDGMTPEEIRGLPYQMLRKKLARQGRGAIGVLAGLAVALVLYPLGCLVGMPVNVFGFSDQTLFWLVTGGVIAIAALARGRA